MHLPGGAPLKLSSLPLVRVTGEGRLEAVPDTAEVSLGVSVRADTAGSAYEQTAAILNKIVAALVAMGIPREQMQSDQVSLQPIYEKEQLAGYEGTGTLRVTLRDLSAVGAVIDRAVEAGANTVRGVRFDLRDPAVYEARVTEAAVQDAQRKAALLARSLGIRLGPVWRVEAEPAPGPVIAAALRVGPAEAIPILPGTLTLVRSVRVEYLIQYP